MIIMVNTDVRSNSKMRKTFVQATCMLIQMDACMFQISFRSQSKNTSLFPNKLFSFCC